MVRVSPSCVRVAISTPGDEGFLVLAGVDWLVPYYSSVMRVG